MKNININDKLYTMKCKLFLLKFSLAKMVKKSRRTAAFFRYNYVSYQ